MVTSLKKAANRMCAQSSEMSQSGTFTNFLTQKPIANTCQYFELKSLYILCLESVAETIEDYFCEICRNRT